MNPNERASLLAAAQEAHGAGRLEESARLFREVAAAGGNDRQAQLYLGIVLGKQGKDAEASQTLRGVLAANPDSFEALFWLSILARRGGDLPEAIALARRATVIQPNNANALNSLGVCEMDAKDLEGAVATFRRAASIGSPHPMVLYNLGTCLGLLGRDEEALSAAQRAVSLAPNSADVHLLIAQTLLNLNDLAGAIREGNAALRLGPNSAQVHRFLGLAFMHQGRAEEAKGHIDRAVAIDPNDGSAYATLGSILQTSGAIAESNEAFWRSIELEPKQGHAYFALVHNQRAKEGDRELLVRMEELASEGTLPPKEVSRLEYGLGKGYEDLGEYEKAMGHYDVANRLARKIKLDDRPFDAKQAAASTDLKIQRYTREFFEASRSQSLDTENPIFIVGMMRSGTTLVEQILSSHPEVTAGGELEFWVRRGGESIGGRGEVDLLKLRGLAQEYLKLLAEIGPGSPYVTDKMPANYLSLGPIHAAFPNAKIVHTRRNPADTAISIYATPNRIRIDYAHDKPGIVAAYREYLRLMDHWRTVIPPNRLMEVRYEDLVDDREKVTRELAAFCGLSWDDALLSHESNRHSVVTPSAWQVRQPIYRTSMDRWRRFEPWLGPFAELLEPPIGQK